MALVPVVPNSRPHAHVVTLGGPFPVLCVCSSDKTGTLTTNEMSVVRFVNFADATNLVSHSVAGTTYEPVGAIEGRTGINAGEAGLAEFAKVRARFMWALKRCWSKTPARRALYCVATRQMFGSATTRQCAIEWPATRPPECTTLVWCVPRALFHQACSLCNEAVITFDGGKYKRIGEPTEAALKVLVEKLGVPGGVSCCGTRVAHARLSLPSCCALHAWSWRCFSCVAAFRYPDFDVCTRLHLHRIVPRTRHPLPTPPPSTGRRRPSASRCWSLTAIARA